MGGLLFGFFGFLTIKWGRHPILLFGCILSLIAYSLMFINFPANPPDDNTAEVGFIEPNTPMALTTSFLLGLSDACYNTQVTVLEIKTI